MRDQISVLILNKPKYNFETLLKSFLIWIQSTKCYRSIRLNNILVLPRPRFLQKISASFKLSPKRDDENSNFLKGVVNGLTDLEKIVSIQIDEIHIKESIDYKNGSISGVAKNKVNETAKTVVTFLVSSCFGSFKEVVRLVPVKQLTGSYLADIASNVLKQVIHCGLKVLCIISDNNRVNRVMFKELTKTSDSDYFFYEEGNPYKIFVLFDSVHILIYLLIYMILTYT